MDMSEKRPCERNSVGGGGTDGQADEVSHKLSSSQPSRPGGSNVSTFTDGLSKAGSTM